MQILDTVQPITAPEAWSLGERDLRPHLEWLGPQVLGPEARGLQAVGHRVAESWNGGGCTHGTERH